jgi:G:T-mismatch repair DNA endonuclease (very short patch repair protein)
LYALARTHARDYVIFEKDAECVRFDIFHLMRKMTQDEFVDRCKIIHNGKYDYSKTIYSNSKNKIIIICPKHGDFLQTAGKHLNKKGCKKCTTAVLMTKEYFVEKCKIVHGDKYDYSKVILVGVKKKVIIICPVHGDYLQVAEKHFIYGCPACAGNKPTTVDEFVQKSSIIHKNKYDYSLITSLNKISLVRIICPKHGVFLQNKKDHMFGKGCKHCAIGNSSKKEQEWLDSLGLPNGHNYRNVKIIVNSHRFFVDGFIPGTNICYEFLGDYWHGHPKKFNPDKLNIRAKKTFRELFEKTKEKIQFLRKNGFKVISIWESKYDKRKNIGNC